MLRNYFKTVEYLKNYLEVPAFTTTYVNQTVTLIFDLHNLIRFELRFYVPSDGGPNPSRGRGILRVGCPTEKHWSLLWCMSKRLNLLRCCLGAHSCEPKEACIRWGQGRINPFTAARGDKTAMRPFVKIL